MNILTKASINSECDGDLGDIINERLKVDENETSEEDEETPLKIEEINHFPGVKKVTPSLTNVF